MNTPTATRQPPAATSLKELQQIPARLQRGELDLSLGKRSREVLSKLLDNPRFSSTHNISELAEAFSISPSTLTRLAQNLGFAGFNALQQLFRESPQGPGHFYSDQLEQGILGTDSRPLSPHTELLQQVVGDELGNIEAMARNLDPRTVRETVVQLAKAPRVFVFGRRQSYSLASFFSYTLGMLRQDVELLGTPGQGLSHALGKLRQGDLLVLIGCAPYSAQTIRVAQLANRHGIELVAITDSHSSPLAAYARYRFISPTDGVFFSNSQAAFMVLIEGLLSQTARYLGDQATTALRYREQLIDDLQDQY
ncbi:MurR/RpiR family transcriptional regulator [Aestuariirhabdus sp. Z084]|uniref:MurR/RpiR family transcriptional regulator n=1 Tax=Aestuariirhabdus haliotis TaxID=2918751 RepID=UPI00201B3642|nr:MurR/RpiR family transcriptional regulator [Aestuariirhabdus haliotis]MCL6416794.1 MurR/RpiR family transcriptional regulator [Aestuariirhabdus haliotis]MCL6420794.1 MurR/RpiR family transcriptional regulator [Aestuariirhabdus haliotis]